VKRRRTETNSFLKILIRKKTNKTVCGGGHCMLWSVGCGRCGGLSALSLLCCPQKSHENCIESDASKQTSKHVGDKARKQPTILPCLQSCNTFRKK
jgi:hypothetical protein